MISSIVTNLIENVAKVVKDTNGTTKSGEQKVARTLGLRFSVAHTSKVSDPPFMSWYDLSCSLLHTICGPQFEMQNASLAVKYLSLPLSNYSVLDTKFISRQSGPASSGSLCDNCFTLSVPLLELTSALNFPIDALLNTDVTVSPDALNR